uniref:Uncharacterized protein n=1 Tax=Leersia perrieri TaxID=77586 RepID=A0A0D9UY21_9ORYZ
MENKGSEIMRSTAGDAKEEEQPPRRGSAFDKFTATESAEAQVFIRAAITDAFEYMKMTEKDVVEKYRRAGKLHKYDPDKEWQKRFARVARAHPPPPCLMALMPQMKQYLQYLDEEDGREDPKYDSNGEVLST